ncbi:MAG: discoidin domain-containing protein [Candidatus Omnitrophota bacterium]
MRKEKITLVLCIAVLCFTAGCSGEKVPIAKQGGIEVVEVSEGDSLVYLNVASAKASSFDITPDWAPSPDPMAPVDGNMLSRWSSDYTEGDQWIYFDLGRIGVVSNVIVYWERAYATAYEILVSNDAESWEKVYEEKNAAGSRIESKFSPVKCRYIKILGRDRINEDWGISIWEVEIYGPAGYNSESTLSKEEYLEKGEDEEKKKEAENRLNKLAGQIISIEEKEFQKGLVYTSWMTEELGMPVSDLTLAEIKETGYDTVAIMVPAYQDKLDSELIYTNDKPGGDTPTFEALAHAIKSCHKLGLRVHLKPHVDPRTDEARINIMPSAKWFDSYEEFIVKYAGLAQENSVELYSVGTELEATTFEAWASRWNRVIDSIKEVYKGKLVYSANWTEYEDVPFWDRMDYIGIDAYFPLSDNNNPSLDELVSSWESIADKIQSWAVEKGLEGKGVLFTEIGYPSADGAGCQPWVAISDKEDQDEQALCFEAVFEVMTKRPWFKGYYIWQYFPQERWSPLGFTVNKKKANEIIEKWLKYEG